MTETSDLQEYVAISGETRIPLHNVWLLFLYASQLYEHGADSFNGIEEYPDQLPDLLARILTSSVEDRLRKPLTPEFAAKRADLRRVRGRIDVLRTETHQLLLRGRVACRFDELSIDTPRNRLVHAALTAIAPLVKCQSLSVKCRTKARTLRALGVSENYRPTDRSIARGRLGRNDSVDRQMLLAARLALELALPTERASEGGIRRRHLSIEDFRRLFEAAIGGFYKREASHEDWRVVLGRTIFWPASDPTPGIGNLLPRMQTDVWLESEAKGRRIILDTKFTSIIQSGRFRQEKLKSDHLYQLYTYVRTQEEANDSLSLTTEGLLLYPATGASMYESFHSSGHRFTAATVDLAKPSANVRQQLLEVVSLSK